MPRKDHFFGLSRPVRHVTELSLARIITNPDQPRKHFDEEKLRELSSSIERHGLLQPIVVRQVSEEKYMIIAGERRFRAHQLLGRETIDALIFEGEPDTEELALIENLQRENLHPLEEAEALSALAERHGYNQEALAEAMGKPPTTIRETLRLNDLPERIKAESRTLDFPKMLLLQVVKVDDDEERERLWEDVKAGRITSVRAAKERRQASKPPRKTDRVKATEVAQALAFGRGFARRLDDIQDEYLSANQREYKELYDISRQVAERMEAVRNLIGEPLDLPPDAQAGE